MGAKTQACSKQELSFYAKKGFEVKYGEGNEEKDLELKSQIVFRLKKKTNYAKL